MATQKHIRRVGRTWFVRMAIPHDVRPAFGGKGEFVASTKQREKREANAIAAQILLGWERDIKRARGEAGKAVHDEAERLASEYRRYRDKPLDVGQADLILNAIDFALTRVAGLGSEISLTALRSPLPDEAALALAQITGNATPFDRHVAAWSEGTHLAGRKSAAQMKRDIEEFSTAQPEATLESLTGGVVQVWVDDLLKINKPSTVRRKLSSLTQYWKWMGQRDIVDREAKIPFEKQSVKDKRSKVEVAKDKRQRFEPADVLKLIDKAETDDNKPLADLIRLASYTGIRRGGLENLTGASFVTVEGIPCLHAEEKSEAGIRDVPVHPNILPLVQSLVQYAGNDGFLIPCTAKRRGDALGKKFSKMKTAMKFDVQHTFHSLRHTVVWMFRRSGCRLDVQNQIIGHEDDSVQAGYGGHVDMAEKLEWVSKAIKYPR
jgi:integrase